MAQNDEKKKNQDPKKISKEIEKRNSRFFNFANQIGVLVRGKNETNAQELDRIDSEVNKIIADEIGNTMGVTASDMSTFLVKLLNDRDRGYYGMPKTIEDIFSSDSGNIYSYFQSKFRNDYEYYENLNSLTSQLFELEEAVMTTRDSIVTSDDISRMVSKELAFEGITESDTYIDSVKSMESKLKLDVALKDKIVYNTLLYGKYYVYTCPYRELFEKHYMKKTRDARFYSGTTTLSESVATESIEILSKDINSTMSKYPNEFQGRQLSSSKISESVRGILGHIKVNNDNIPIPISEGVDMSGIMDPSSFQKKVTRIVNKTESNRKPKGYTTDATIQADAEKEFVGVKGCYVKYIDPRFLIPIKILDTVLGYYYIQRVSADTQFTSFAGHIQMNPTSLSGGSVQSMLMPEDQLIGSIADNVVRSFDKKFLDENGKFKELIVNALRYHDMYKNQINFQFIPAEYITEFKINEDADGEGQSMLKKSVFYANLYRTLLIFKMVSIVNKSNDTKIYYIKNSGIETNITNKVHQVAREVKQTQINFNDFLSFNSMISKIGASKEIFMPVGSSGERGIDFDILSGQDIPLNTELMEMLRSNMINATGVPSVIMDYINEADYARTLDVGNIKFASRVISYQMTFNDGMTELYKKLMLYEGLSIPEDVIYRFVYTLSKPKTRNLSNEAELFSQAEQSINARISAVMGEEGQNQPEAGYIKDYIYKKMIKKYVPSEMWEEIEDLYEEAQIEARSQINKLKASEEVE